MRVLVFGDSITQGFWDSKGGWVARLRKSYDDIAIKNIRGKEDQPEMFNLGISGDSTIDLLKRIEPETVARKWPNDPLIVIVAIGTNDDLFEKSKQKTEPEQFRKNIQEIIRLIKPKVQDMLFVGNTACDEAQTTPVFWSSHHFRNDQMELFEKIVKETVEKEGIGFVPVYEKFKSELDAGKNLLADGLHPNDAGHKLIYNLVKPALDKLLQ